jgi:hypothetical protein
MMIKTLLPLALALPSILSPLPVQAQSVPITVGMNYGVARQRLIQAGWQPLTPGGARALWSYGSQDYMDQQMMLAGAFRRQKWFETLGCAPTGLGTCQHQFFDINGRGLIVETGSGGYGSIPDVTKFYLKDGTK